MKIKSTNIIISLLIVCFLVFSGAETSCNMKNTLLNGKEPTSLTKDDATKAVTGFANIMAGAAATVAIIYIIIGGIEYITSAGNQEKAQKAKGTLTWAVIGFILIIASYAIVTYFVKFIQGS